MAAWVMNGRLGGGRALQRGMRSLRIPGVTPIGAQMQALRSLRNFAFAPPPGRVPAKNF